MLRSLVFFALVAICHCFTMTDHISEAGRSLFIQSDEDTVPPCSKLYSCSDCNTARICRPSATGWVQVASYQCTPASPYCQSATGTCSKDPDNGCGTADKFICPSISGHFPDYSNCSLYHVCDNFTSSTFACAAGLNYNAAAKDCESDAVCSKVDCTNQQAKKVPFKPYTGYFAYCWSGQPTMIDRCPGNFELNTTSQTCDLICHQSGLLADPTDCQTYYLCSRLPLPDDLVYYTKKAYTCPTGQGFNPDKFMCTDKSEISGCK